MVRLYIDWHQAFPIWGDNFPEEVVLSPRAWISSHLALDRDAGISEICGAECELMPGPEFFSKLHLTILEVEGLLFNVLLFCRFFLSEMRTIVRTIRRWF